jgi:hypothetical protein
MTIEPVTDRSRQPSPGYLAVIRAIDGITTWTGYAFTILIVPLVIANVIEVFMRYVMKEPTTWALDATTMSFGALFMLGAAYALLKGAHVRTDMLWEKFSDRKKGVIDSIAYILFFLPSMAILFAVDRRAIDLEPLATAALAPPGGDPDRRGAALHPGHFRTHEEPVGGPYGTGSDASREDRGLTRDEH